jgi:hypothetical protein
MYHFGLKQLLDFGVQGNGEDSGIAVRAYWFMDVYFDVGRVTEISYYNFYCSSQSLETPLMTALLITWNKW